MISVRGRIFRFFTGLSNVNTIAHPDAVVRMKRMAEKYMNYRVPKGFLLFEKETDLGTKYMLLKREKKLGNKKVLYYLHGGCYMCGLTSNYISFGASLCKDGDIDTFVALDYSLAPEYKYPTQLNEAYDVWTKLIQSGVSPEDIYVGGDSSGGNLALSLLLKIRDEGGAMPGALFLLSPWTDMTGSGQSYEVNYNRDVQLGDKKGTFDNATKECLLNGDLYSFLGGADRKDYYVSPIFADLTGFPRTYLSVGSHEMLLDDVLGVGKELSKAGVPVITDIKEEMFHSYLLYEKYMPESKESYETLINFLEEACSSL